MNRTHLILSLLLSFLIGISAPSQAFAIDSDGDRIDDSIDNCAFAFNPDQADADSNGVGDVCDILCGDIDNDGLEGQTDDWDYYLNWMLGDGPAPPVLSAANIGGCSGVNIYDFQLYLTSAFVPIVPLCWHQIECEPVVDNSALTLDHVDGRLSTDTIMTGREITFHLRLKNDTSGKVIALDNGFRVYSPTGAVWDTTIVGRNPILGLGHSMWTSNTSGDGEDSVSIRGISFGDPGIPEGFDTIAYTITIGPIDSSYSGGTICLDSTWFPPAGEWMWVTWQIPSNYQFTYPSWDGPHCFTIHYCCDPRGDVDHANLINVSDLTYLVAYLFQGGVEPVCVDQGNVDGVEGPGGPHDVSDLTYLVAYLFQGGPEPPSCD